MILPTAIVLCMFAADVPSPGNAQPLARTAMQKTGYPK
jgi:hypothetical protein